MIIAALMSFGALLVAWIVAPSEPANVAEPPASVGAEALAEAA